MIELKQGQSTTIGILIADGYDMSNIDNVYLYINQTKFTPTIIDRMLRVEMSSKTTSVFIGTSTVRLIFDDKTFGRREYVLENIVWEATKARVYDDSVDLGYTVTHPITISETAIEAGDVMYDYVKGSAGSLSSVTASVDSNVGTPEVIVTYDGENADFAFKNLKGDKGKQGEQGEQGEKGDDAVLPANIVIDPNYVHTDNNYTNADKAKVAGALATSHTALLDKNAEPSFQHLDTTTEKTTPIGADSFGLWDSVTSTFKRLSVANMLTWFRGLPHTFTQLITFSGGVKSPTYQDLKGNNPFVTQNGGTIYHTTPWINTGTVNIVAGANTFSGSGTSFTTAMVGAKLIVNGEERIIASVSGQNGTIGGLWNESFIGSFLVFSISAKFLNGIIDFLNAYTGASIATISNGAVESKINHYFYSQVNISDTINIKGVNPFNVTDLSLKRNSAGILEINNGTAGQFRDLKLRSVQVTDNTAAASIDKVGTTRYRPAANGSYYEICMQTGSNTFVWHTIEQYTW